MSKACAFCEIAAGRAAGAMVLDEPGVLAFLDRRPLFKGHVLLIPRAHVETLADLPEEMVGPLFGAARRLSAAVRDAMGAEGTFVAMNNRVSQSVPHLHIHVVPRTKGDGLKGFFWPRTGYADEEEMLGVSARIRGRLGSSPG